MFCILYAVVSPPCLCISFYMYFFSTVLSVDFGDAIFLSVMYGIMCSFMFVFFMLLYNSALFSRFNGNIALYTQCCVDVGVWFGI